VRRVPPDYPIRRSKHPTIASGGSRDRVNSPSGTPRSGLTLEANQTLEGGELYQHGPRSSFVGR
jgi:hypothetical protein